MSDIGLPELFVILLILGIVACSIVISIFYLLTLSRSLSLTQKHHGVSPGLVWLLLIPLFNLGWQFYILNKVTKGIKGKFNEMGKECGDGGWSMGLAYAILGCCAIIPYIGILIGMAAFITWIIYWVKIAGYNKLMA